MADASIRIKLGQIEVEYQGDESFLKTDLLEILKKLLELQKQYPAAPPSSSHAKGEDAGGGGAGDGKFDHSTDTIANALGAKTGPDLVMAAAAHLHFVKGKPKFTRAEIVAEMRTATGHFKESYFANLTQSLNSLKSSSKDSLRLVSNDTYALSNKERQALEAKLAEI
jgi:hypothetical protein